MKKAYSFTAELELMQGVDAMAKAQGMTRAQLIRSLLIKAERAFFERDQESILIDWYAIKKKGL